eukprot:5919017-Pyramimonas_sp.AAC.1
MAAAKATLREKGVDLATLTPQQLKETLGDTKMKSLFSAYGYTLKTNAPALYERYDKGGDVERRQWLTRFIMDASSGGHQGKATVSVNQSTKHVADEEWLTEEQLASPLYMNSKHHASIIIHCLEERPHRMKALADLGVREYKYSKEILRRVNGREEKTEIAAVADMTEGDYRQ